MRLCCARSWRAYASDRVPCRNQDMDRRRYHRHAPRLLGAAREDADGSRSAAVFRSHVCFSRAQRRPDKSSLVRWRRIVLVRQASGARPLPLAAGYGRNGFSAARTAFDAPQGHRLAATAADLGAADRGVSGKCDSPVFMRVSSTFSTHLHGILRAWIAFRYWTSMRSKSKR